MGGRERRRRGRGLRRLQAGSRPARQPARAASEGPRQGRQRRPRCPAALRLLHPTLTGAVDGVELWRLVAVPPKAAAGAAGAAAGATARCRAGAVCAVWGGSSRCLAAASHHVPQQPRLPASTLHHAHGCPPSAAHQLHPRPPARVLPGPTPAPPGSPTPSHAGADRGDVPGAGPGAHLPARCLGRGRCRPPG